VFIATSRNFTRDFNGKHLHVSRDNWLKKPAISIKG
jgi:hypothetical protein